MISRLADSRCDDTTWWVDSCGTSWSRIGSCPSCCTQRWWGWSYVVSRTGFKELFKAFQEVNMLALQPRSTSVIRRPSHWVSSSCSGFPHTTTHRTPAPARPITQASTLKTGADSHPLHWLKCRELSYWSELKHFISCKKKLEVCVFVDKKDTTKAGL